MRKFIIFLVLFGASFSFGATRTVGNCNGSSGTYNTIPQALQAANSGDTIGICAGTYNANTINITKSNLTIMGLSADFSDVLIKGVFSVQTSGTTIKNLSMTKKTLIKTSGSASGSLKLENLTLTNIADSDYSGAAINIRSGSLNRLDMKNVTIKANDSYGLAISSSIKNVVLTDLDITSYYPALSLSKVKNVVLTGGNFKSDQNSGEPAIEVYNAGDITLNSICSSGGNISLHIGSSVKTVTMRNSNISNYLSNGIVVNGTSNKVILDMTSNCFYGDDVIEDNRNNNSDNINGNYFQRNSQASEMGDNHPLSKCPSFNLYNCGNLKKKLKSNHKFDKCGLGNGSVAKDSKNTIYNGVLNGYVFTDPLHDEDKVCNNLTFFKNSYVKIPNASRLLNKTASLSFWIRTTQSRVGAINPQTSPGIIGYNGEIYWGWISFTGHIGIDTNPIGLYGQSNRSIADGYWHHVVLTRALTSNYRSKFQIFIDGTLDKSGSLKKRNLTNIYYDKLGGIQNGYDFEGSLDEVKIYEGALTKNDVKQIYDNEKVGKNVDGSTPTCETCYKLKHCYSDGFNKDLEESWDPLVGAKGFMSHIRNGRLRLTDNTTTWASSGAVVKGKVPTKDNIFLTTFNHYAYSGSTTFGGFGTALVFSDATMIPKMGGNGGSLGYANRDFGGIMPGFKGGWLGIGLDEQGQYSADTAGKVGGKNGALIYPDAIAVRGAWYNQYRFLQGTTSRSPIIDNNTLSNTPAPGYLYRVMTDNRNSKTLTIASRKISANCDSTNKELNCWQRLANYDVTQNNVRPDPTELRVGFTASNGVWPTVNNHEIDNFDFKAINCGSIGETQETPASGFDAWDKFRSVNDRNISTKIVEQSFSITVGSLEENTSNFQDFKGTVCAEIVQRKKLANGTYQNTPLMESASGYPVWKRWYVDENSDNKQSVTFKFKAQKASPNARVHLIWKNEKDEPCPMSGDVNSTYSSDNFAIRPYNLNVYGPEKMKAGVKFHLHFFAKNILDKPTLDYNETSGTSFLITYKEQNSPTCKTGLFDGNISNQMTFENGVKHFETSYSEIGIVDVNISDLTLECDKLYASVDCKDKNVKNWFNNNVTTRIGNMKATITFTPDHFDMNSSLKNFDDGKFTYLSRDIDKMYASLDVNISARNHKGNAIENYSSQCYAKNNALNIKHNTLTVNPSGALKNIIIHEANIPTDMQIPINDDIDMDVPKGLFNNGLASLSINVNFDRDYSKPVNPITLSVQNVTSTDEDGIGSSPANNIGNATFFYGRLKIPDVSTTQKSISNGANFEIYDTTSSYSWLQNSLHWYRNLWHTKKKLGETKDIIGTKLNGTLSASTSDKLGSKTIGSVNAGAQGMKIGLGNLNNDITVHVKTNPWLWHTDARTPQAYSDTGSCLKHPCFDIYPTDSSGQIESGEFDGSDVTITQESNSSIKRGVKIFR